MTIKEFFRQVREAERELYLIRRQQEHIRDMAVSLRGMSQNGIRSPSRRSRVEDAGVRIADLEAALNERAMAYNDLVERAQRIIDQIPQMKFREVLTLRYLCGHSWRTVSDEMDFEDPKSVYRVHGLALMAAKKIYEDTT